MQQGATWLRDLADLLEPDAASLPTGETVADHLRTYLEDLLQKADMAPRLEAFRHHLNKVSLSYWPGLFHCYDLEDLPRTNNDLESHFRETQRRLLRTTGQRGQTRRALQRIGAWELLPRPTHEDECRAVFRQIPRAQLIQEQQRLRQHQERFRLQTRSTRQIQAQFNRLRQQWFALPISSTG